MKKLATAGIADYEAANRYLRAVDLPGHNRRYARRPAEEVNYHLGLPPRLDCRNVFRLERSQALAQAQASAASESQGDIPQCKFREVPGGPFQAARATEARSLALIRSL